MSKNYTRDHLKLSVAKILHTLGWNSINSTPLEILTDILGTFIGQITKTANNYANEFGQTEPNLDQLALTFRDMGINVAELEEYVTYVKFCPPPAPVPKYPIPKEDHLNFLKPGSKEVVTRPVHIHEHLPPMNPLLEGNEHEIENGIKVEETDENTNDIFKKPADLPLPRPSIRREEEGSRPTREISSVMMTTSGFLSPAREGKLPESRTPAAALEPSLPPPTPPAPVVEEVKKPPKLIKKPEKKRERVIKPDGVKTADDKVKKLQNPKILKNKPKAPHNMINPFAINKEVNISPVQSTPSSNSKVQQQKQLNKALAVARLKTEKLNTTITPIIIKPVTPQPNPQPDVVDKLFSEPDKKKVNIFKKITNVKNEKEGKIKKEELRESRESSPDLIIDEPDEIVQKLSHLPSDVTIEPINPSSHAKNSPKEIEHLYYDDDDQPGTPSAPKTPEMISQSPPLFKEKQRKRKEGKRIKKIPKHQSPTRLDSESIDIDMERPKTPEAQVLPKMEKLDLHLPPFIGAMPFPFLPNFARPGLIPANPLFSPFPLGIPNFGQKPYMPPLNPTNVSPDLSVKLEEPERNIPTSLEKPCTSELEILPTTTATTTTTTTTITKPEKKIKEHKKDKKDKIKKRNKKDKTKNKGEKRKLKEEKKEKIKKEKKEKRKDKELKDESQGVKITLRIKSPSPRPETPETRKLNIKPIVKKEDDAEMEEQERKRETSPALAKISALVTGPPKPKTNPPVSHSAFNDNFPSSSSDNFVTHMKKTMFKSIPKIRTKEIRRDPEVPLLPPVPSKYTDADGNEVWICPACGRQDDGSPMIGCDGGCDAWYHWVCVGIQVPPDDNEDWYCRHCLLKKNEDLQSDKQKKKRKKKEKKEH